PVSGAAIGFRALRSDRWIGVGWLIHAGWDIAHHLWGNPIWPFMPSSAFGCMIFDSLIALWFLAGAPSFLKRPHAATRAAGACTKATPKFPVNEVVERVHHHHIRLSLGTRLGGPSVTLYVWRPWRGDGGSRSD